MVNTAGFPVFTLAAVLNNFQEIGLLVDIRHISVDSKMYFFN